RRLFFFEGDVVSLEKSRGRALAGSNPPLAQFSNGLLQGQVRLFGNESQYLFRMPFQRRNASSTGFRRATPALVPSPQPSHRRTRGNTETFRHLPPRCSCFHSLDHAPPQVSRIRLWHPAPLQGESIPDQSVTSDAFGVTAIVIGAELVYGCVGVERRMDTKLDMIVLDLRHLRMRAVCDAGPIDEMPHRNEDFVEPHAL